MTDVTIISLYNEYLDIQVPSVNTIKNYRNDVGHFLSWLKNRVTLSEMPNSDELIEHISEADTRSYVDHLVSNRFSPDYINRKLSALRKFFNFTHSQGISRVNPILSIPNISTINIDSRSIDESQEAVNRLIDGFTTALKREGTADSTMKNYSLDLYQFCAWLRKSRNN